MPAPTTTAVVLAGGIGARAGHHLPKQLFELDGRPLLAFAVDAFLASSRVDDVLVVMARAHLAAARDAVGERVLDVVAGGEERHDSVWLALQHLRDHAGRVLVHDAARPLVPATLVDAVCDALDAHDAVVPVLDVTDTVARVEGDTIAEVPDRASLRRVQTPQGFDADVLWRAHARGRATPGFRPTDDASVVLRHGGSAGSGLPVHVVPGDERAFKVTVPADLDRLRRVLDADPA